METQKEPKLFERLCEALRSRHYSKRTEQAYCNWVFKVRWMNFEASGLYSLYKPEKISLYT